MMAAMQDNGFGACSNTQACTLACPKEIAFENITMLNREFMRASIKSRPEADEQGVG